MKGKNGFIVFPSPEAGIIAFCINLKSYERLNLRSLSTLSGKYVNGKVDSPSPTWTNAVWAFHYQITSDMEKYFHMLTEDLDPESKHMTMKPIEHN